MRDDLDDFDGVGGDVVNTDDGGDGEHELGRLALLKLNVVVKPVADSVIPRSKS